MKVSEAEIVILSISAAVIAIVVFIILLGAIMRALRPARTHKLAMRQAYGSTPIATVDPSYGAPASHHSSSSSSTSDIPPLTSSPPLSVSSSDQQLLDHFLLMLQRDGLSLRMLTKEGQLVEVRLSLLAGGDHHTLSWQTGSVNLRDDIVAVRAGKPHDVAGAGAASGGGGNEGEEGGAGAGQGAMANIGDELCFSLVARAGGGGADDVNLVAGSSLERSALKQGFDMLVQSLNRSSGGSGGGVGKEEEDEADVERAEESEDAPLLA